MFFQNWKQYCETYCITASAPVYGTAGSDKESANLFLSLPPSPFGPTDCAVNVHKSCKNLLAECSSKSKVRLVHIWTFSRNIDQKWSKLHSVFCGIKFSKDGNGVYLWSEEWHVVIVRFVVNDKLSQSTVCFFCSTQTKDSVQKSSNTAAQLYSQGKHNCKPNSHVFSIVFDQCLDDVSSVWIISLHQYCSECLNAFAFLENV